METEQMVRLAVKTLDSKKAEKIEVLRVYDMTVLADYFILCSASNTTQTRAIADELVYRLGEEGIRDVRVEGYTSNTWILVDCGSVVVHIFYRDTRDFYKLEKLWGDAERIPVGQILEKKDNNQSTGVAQ